MLTTLASLLYPPACLLCRAPVPDDRAALCRPCQLGLTARPSPVRRLEAGASAAPLPYTPLVREAVHAFKYDQHLKIGAWLARQMVRTAHASFPLSTVSVVAPVPMHWLKRRVKGHDPVAWLADEVASALELSYQPGLLHRRRWTPSQTRLSPARRLRNVRDAFRLNGRVPAGSAVLLIDDVLTSGATAGECARTLRAGGAGEVFVLTAAQARG